MCYSKDVLAAFENIWFRSINEFDNILNLCFHKEKSKIWKKEKCGKPNGRSNWLTFEFTYYDWAWTAGFLFDNLINDCSLTLGQSNYTIKGNKLKFQLKQEKLFRSEPIPALLTWRLCASIFEKQLTEDIIYLSAILMCKRAQGGNIRYTCLPLPTKTNKSWVFGCKRRGREDGLKNTLWAFL